MNDQPTIRIRLELELEVQGQCASVDDPTIPADALVERLMDGEFGIFTDGQVWTVVAASYEADPISCWYTLESKVYHSNRLCSSLNREDRYWPIHGTVEPPKLRRLCAICARGENDE